MFTLTATHARRYSIPLTAPTLAELWNELREDWYTTNCAGDLGDLLDEDVTPEVTESLLIDTAASVWDCSPKRVQLTKTHQNPQDLLELAAKIALLDAERHEATEQRIQRVISLASDGLPIHVLEQISGLDRKYIHRLVGKDYFAGKAKAWLNEVGAPDAAYRELADWAANWVNRRDRKQIAGCFITQSGKVLGDVARKDEIHGTALYAAKEVVDEYGLKKTVADMACAELKHIVDEPVIIAEAWRVAQGQRA